MNLSKFSSDRFRWAALVFLSLGLAIVIIDNTVLNVAIPYILRDLNTSLDAIQWIISGYALIIATLLITVGRLGDLFGRKRIFIVGLVFFAIGSFIASLAPNATILFIGEALIEAIGASMMLTSSLSLLVSEFQGKERALAFGVWGSVAGASATLGPLIGGYLTTYYSWRWSLRINVLVAIIAIAGTIFIKESRGEGEKKFDWFGTVFSGVGLFSLVFSLIEGQKYGWWTPNQSFSVFGWTWPATQISVIPFTFWFAAFFLLLFVFNEYRIEKRGGSPLLRLSMFKNLGFSMGLSTLLIISLGQFGAFFVLPIFLQNVLGLDAFKTGVVFLSASISIFIFGPLSGFISSKVNPKWVVTIGMFISALGLFILSRSLSLEATGWSLAPGLLVFGVGIGLSGAQITNIILSSVPGTLAGEASAASSTVRQVGTSIGIAIIGVVLANTLSSGIENKVRNDNYIPYVAKEQIISSIKGDSVESGRTQNQSDQTKQNPLLAQTVKKDVNQALSDASQAALSTGLIFVLAGSFLSILIPAIKPMSWQPPLEKSTNSDLT